MTDSKPTNPKDAVGSTKLAMDLVPESAVAEMAMSFLEGALKYGRYNWREKGVRASIYYSAMRRHMSKWLNGEDEDAVTHVSHLASVMACCAIILDAKLLGKLNDDRPPRAPVSDHIDGLQGKIAHLQELFKDENPYQYTIADSPVDCCGKAPCDYSEYEFMQQWQGKFYDDSKKCDPLLSPAVKVPELIKSGPAIKAEQAAKKLENLQRINNPPTPGVRFEIKDKEKLASMQKLEDRIGNLYQKYSLEQIDKFLSIAKLHGVDPFDFISSIERVTQSMRKAEDCRKAADELSKVRKSWSKNYDTNMKEQCIQAALDHLHEEAEKADHTFFGWLDEYGYYLSEDPKK